MRTAGTAPLLWYEATPRLAIASVELAPGKNANGTLPTISLDLRRNPLRVVGRNASMHDLVAANLARGILDGAIEDAAAALGSGSGGVVSTEAMMATARRN